MGATVAAAAAAAGLPSSSIPGNSIEKRGTSAFDAAAAAAVRQLSYSELVSDAETETKKNVA